MRMPVDHYTVTIPGPGQPQGSSRAFVKGGRAIVTSANPKLKGWKKSAVLYVRQVLCDLGIEEPWEGPVRVVVGDYRKRPKGSKRALPTVRPDLDKILRSAGDVLTTAGAIKDDAQVCEIEAWKEYCQEPCICLTVWRIERDG
jgi:Holliday junction resolvase RusA-like endonuclease